MQLLSRSDAHQQRVKRYFTGIPCKRGHVDERLVSSTTCVACNRDTVKRRYHTNESYNAQLKYSSKKRHALLGCDWHHKNKERSAVLNQTWIAKHKDAHMLKKAEWRSNNKARLAYLQAKRRASKIQATPAWANHDEIQRYYTEATKMTKETGTCYTVDHIIPLNGKLVCGLHVEYNLQLLTLSENSRKGNRT